MAERFDAAVCGMIVGDYEQIGQADTQAAQLYRGVLDHFMTDCQRWAMAAHRTQAHLISVLLACDFRNKCGMRIVRTSAGEYLKGELCAMSTGFSQRRSGGFKEGGKNFCACGSFNHGGVTESV